jgi:hypothetical protein
VRIARAWVIASIGASLACTPFAEATDSAIEDGGPGPGNDANADAATIDGGDGTAAPSDIGLGDDRDGSRMITSDGMINEYFAVVGPIAKGALRARIGTTPLPRAGEVVIIWQASGTAAVPATDSTAVALEDKDGAGR